MQNPLAGMKMFPILFSLGVSLYKMVYSHISGISFHSILITLTSWGVWLSTANLRSVLGTYIKPKARVSLLVLLFSFHDKYEREVNVEAAKIKIGMLPTLFPFFSHLMGGQRERRVFAVVFCSPFS